MGKLSKLHDITATCYIMINRFNGK